MSMLPIAPASLEANAEQESLVILQSLICLLREKNLLTRADIEELCDKVERRAKGTSSNPLPYSAVAASNASTIMHKLSFYIGNRYGGKHRRSSPNSSLK